MSTALIITGQLRSLEHTIDYLNEFIIVPNNAVLFILCETSDENSLIDLINSKSIKLGGILTAKSFKNHEYEQILKMIENSNRAGLTEEVFNRNNFSFDYLKNSGSILQYYQFWKLWFKVLEYEKLNSMKFINCIRSRPDVLFTKKFVVEDFYSEQKFKDLFEDYNCRLLKANHYGDESIFNIDTENTIITYAVELVWFGRRSLFDKLSQILFHYGLWDSGESSSFNSETTFHQFCKNFNIYHTILIEKNWPMYTYNTTDALAHACSILR